MKDFPEQGSEEVNEACWKFIRAMPHSLPTPIWNDLKPAMYVALKYFVASVYPEEVVPSSSHLSWSGFNIHGNEASIKAVQDALHDAGTVPQLKQIIRDLSELIGNKQ